ncbi:MAG: hypothetical protein WBQ60_05340 [Asticcacaulis sp.]
MSRTIKTALSVSACLLIGVLLSQCSEKQNEKTADADFSYTVALSLTPEAAAKMKALGQKVALEAYYYGAPAAASQALVNDDNQINLGADLQDIEAVNANVKISANGLFQDRLVHIADARPMVMLSAYSEATAGTPNQLDCTEFKGALSEAQAKPVEIKCGLPQG